VLTATVTIAVVQTASMGPEVPAGSFVVYVKSDSYKQGDVILFHVYGVLVTHRIVKVTPSGFSTEGDTNSIADPWIVPTESVRGKLLFMVPHLGTIILFLRAPLVFATLITAAFAQAIWSNVSSSKKQQAEKHLSGDPNG
jgi:signal peptidase